MSKLALFLVTGFGSGYTPKAPGTFGSAVGVLCVYGLAQLVSWPYSAVIITLAASVICLLLGSRAERDLGSKDPQAIVIDEVAGQALALFALAQPSWTSIAAAFILFRFFDIVKPLGIKRLQRYRGGKGILVDDLAAGAAALMIVSAARVLLG